LDEEFDKKIEEEALFLLKMSKKLSPSIKSSNKRAEIRCFSSSDTATSQEYWRSDGANKIHAS